MLTFQLTVHEIATRATLESWRNSLTMGLGFVAILADMPSDGDRIKRLSWI
jgi:hypothetical protein